jgi:hypothetical protein
MNEMALIDAVKAGDYDKTSALIGEGANVNQQDKQGWTPLNFAAGIGNLAMVKLLVDRGADIFKVGRDQRTPYMIALAAGRVSVVKFLREMEDQYPGEKPSRPERKYCKAFYLRDLRKYSGWSESRINWKAKDDNNKKDEKVDPAQDSAFPDDKIIFIHQDFTVTESMWQGENVIFNSVTAEWRGFCAGTLGFKVPDDLDLIVPNEPTA